MNRSRRSFIQKLAALSAATALSKGLTSCTSQHRRPNIIFIMADDLGYGHLGCYGQKHILTPNIDQLAAEGVKFTQAYSGASVCAPSRCALMTGLHGGHISVRGNSGGISMQEADVTVAQLLKKSGYVTGLFGKWGLGIEGTPGAPNNKGFDQFFGYLHQLHAQFYYPEFIWENENRYHIPENASGGRQVYSHDLMMARAFDFIRKNRSRPFFLYLPMLTPHHEFIAPEESLGLYRGKFDENPVDHWRDGYALPREPRATFAAMVTHMDKTVGQLMSLLKELGLDSETILFFTSDNGPAHGPLENAEFFQANGPLRGYKGGLYEGGLRVPMIVRWPGRIEPSSTTNHVTFFPDILPTLLELAGAMDLHPDRLDGHSIVPVLTGRGPAKTHDFLYWELADYEHDPPYRMESSTLQQAMRLGRWKAVKNRSGAGIELYDLVKDPGEQADLAALHPETVRDMGEIMKTCHHEAPPQDPNMSTQRARQLFIPSQEDIEKWRER